MEEKIRIENVTKKFGSYAALDGISLSFEKGKIHGMIGRNGSGKTVLFKCICGFLLACRHCGLRADGNPGKGDAGGTFRSPRPWAV